MAASSSDLSPLITILTREQAIYQELLEVAGVEREAIVESRLTDLKAALQHKQEVLARLAKLEDRRISWLRRYAGKHDLDLETVTLAAIIEGSADHDRSVLTRLHRSLRRRIEKVVEVNRVTGSLLEGVLRSIDSSLRYLLADDGAGATYVAQGRLQLAPVAAIRQLLDYKA